MIPLDSYNLRQQFPALTLKINGKPLVFLDNGASTQKPAVVIDGMSTFYRESYANVHRGAYTLSEKATNAFEKARVKVQKFINAKNSKEIIFTKGTTDGINLVAATFGRHNVKEGDEILISAMEHHSNIVPWQMLCEEKKANLKIIPMSTHGVLLLDEYEKLLSSKTKLVAITQVSNALGTINPIKEMIQSAHKKNIPVLIDGAQALPHMKVDVQDLDCDFYVFSGHKIYGPTGIGILYGKEKILDAMPPYQGGGDMIRSVTFEKTTYNHLPYKFEAGTPAIVEAYGLGLALDYVSEIGLDKIAEHERQLLLYATEKISKIPEVKIYGTAQEKSGILSFTIEGVHPHDTATILDNEGIAIRAGHHCAQPVMDFFNIPATARASFGLYNTMDDVDILISGIRKVITMFK